VTRLAKQLRKRWLLRYVELWKDPPPVAVSQIEEY
jgi:hypothetical protein